MAARHFQSKLNFDLGPAARVAPFFSLTADRDPFRRLALRSQGGTGIRHGFYKADKGEASLRAAVLYSHERFTPEADRSPRSDGAWSFKLNANQRLGETIRIENTSSYDPVMNDFSDYNVDVTSKLSTRITQSLALNVSHTYAYDSTPVESVRPADQRVQTGLTISF